MLIIVLGELIHAQLATAPRGLGRIQGNEVCTMQFGGPHDHLQVEGLTRETHDSQKELNTCNHS